jgi:hypothetical protein
MILACDQGGDTKTLSTLSGTAIDATIASAASWSTATFNCDATSGAASLVAITPNGSLGVPASCTGANISQSQVNFTNCP